MIAALAVSAGVVVGYLAVVAAIRRAALPAAVSPVVVAALLLGGLLGATGTPLARFAQLTAPLHLLLAPAIVALGAGVHRNRAALRRAAGPLALAIPIGAVTGIASAVLLARALGLAPLLRAATVTRTVSTPFAILVQTRVGGPVSLAAGLAVATGVVGALLLPPLLHAVRLRDSRAVGTAAGVAAHLVGTDAVGRRDPIAGSFAGAALVGTGVLVALVVPPLWPWLIG